MTILESGGRNGEEGKGESDRGSESGRKRVREREISSREQGLDGKVFVIFLPD